MGSSLRRVLVVLAVAALTAACNAPSDASLPSASPSASSTAPIVTSESTATSHYDYTADQISSVTVLERTAAPSDDDCTQWSVELGGLADDTSQTDSTASSVSPAPFCQSGTVPPITRSVTLTAEQVTSFRTMLNQVGINTWSQWLADQDGPPPLPSGALIYTINVLVNGERSIYHDIFDVVWAKPSGWSDFLATIQQIVPS